MRQTKLFTKTTKDTPKDEISLNSKLLIRAGFIDKLMSGVYTILPLGWRVLEKIEKIIKDEINKIGGQEIYMPSLSPRYNWAQTKRLETVDVLFEARGANKLSRKINSSSYILNSTHEEVVTPLVKKFASSYKDLPVSVYQIQNKFRNEPRAKSGLLRCREFRMKDLYSFHKTEKDLNEYYEKSKIAYTNIFNRIGIGDDTYITLASGGDFTTGYSHEFQTKCDAGEDICFYDKSTNICFNKEVAPSMVPPVEDNSEEKEMEKIKTKGMVTVSQVIEYLKIDIKNTVKTLFYKIDNDFVAVAVRGDYEVDEGKLKKILNCKEINLASRDNIKKLTGAEVGYAGLINLSKDIKIIIDDSLKNRKNLEMGANETNFHYINVNFGRDIKEPHKFFDIKIIKKGDYCPETKKEYEVFKASEVGNIFPLNTKFSQYFNYYYLDKDGEQKIIYMGCYGIGSTRLMGVIVEKYADEKGLIWPEQIAPFKIHLLDLNQKKESEEIYNMLQKENFDVLYDDRDNIAAGRKFADSDLIGCPIRLVVSKKTIEAGSVEMKKRNSDNSEIVKIDKLIERLKK